MMRKCKEKVREQGNNNRQVNSFDLHNVINILSYSILHIHNMSQKYQLRYYIHLLHILILFCPSFFILTHLLQFTTIQIDQAIHCMNRSRKRQFDQFRSNAASVKSETNSMRSSKMSESTVSEACVNSDRHRKIQKEEKQKDRAQFRKNYQLTNSWVDEQTNFRENMKKNALDHNAKMIEQQKQAKKIERQQQLQYAEKLIKNISMVDENMKNQVEAEKQKQNQYYSQIHQQYLDELHKKDATRFRKQKDQDNKNQGLPFYNPDTTQQKNMYRKQLERQIQQKRAKESRQKQFNKTRERQILEQSKKEAEKYHADSYEPMKMTKQQVFQGLRKIEEDKRRKTENERKTNQEERMRQIRQDNEQRSKAIKIKMKQMQSYVNGLKSQLFEKEQKLRASKISDARFTQKFPKSQEQILAELELKKECKNCHKDYPQEYISPVPKKT